MAGNDEGRDSSVQMSVASCCIGHESARETSLRTNLTGPFMGLPPFRPVLEHGSTSHAQSPPDSIAFQARSRALSSSASAIVRARAAATNGLKPDSLKARKRV